MVFILSVLNYSACEELEEERRCYLCSEAEGIAGRCLQETLLLPFDALNHRMKLWEPHCEDGGRELDPVVSDPRSPVVRTVTPSLLHWDAGDPRKQRDGTSPHAVS